MVGDSNCDAPVFIRGMVSTDVDPAVTPFFYTDCYGHISGDACLQNFAGVINDIAVAHGAPADAAIPHAKSAISDHVTASFGVGTIVPPAGRHPADFVRAVEALLYGAKNNGRNQIAATSAP